ncbi:MAG TPA: hypothetical protein VIN40_00780 [Candidatus Tyrphobacter sp.]
MSIRSLLVFLCAAALLAGCKSTGIALNPPGGTGNVVTLEIPSYDVGTSLGAIAYETGPHGAWKPLPSGATSFTVPGSTRSYGVAYVCTIGLPPVSIGRSQPEGVQPQQGARTTEYAVQATLDDYHIVAVSCADAPTTSVSGTYDVTAVGGASITAAGNYQNGSTGSYSGSVPSNTTDLLAEAYDAGGNTVGVKTYPGTSVGTTPVTRNVTFTASDALGPTHMLTATAAPAGFSQYSEALYLTSDLAAHVFMANSNGGTLTYPSVAAGDATGLYGLGSYGYYYNATASQTVAAFDVTATASAVSLTIPTAWAPSSPVNTANNPTFTMNYAGFPSPPAGSIFSYNAYFEAPCTAGNCVSYANATNKFLRSTGASTYQVPQVALSGFPTFNGVTGNRVTWYTYAELSSGSTVDYAFGLSLYQYFIDSEARGVPQSLRSAAAGGSGRVIPLSNSTSGGTAELSGEESCYVIGGGTCGF